MKKLLLNLIFIGSIGYGITMAFGADYFGIERNLVWLIQVIGTVCVGLYGLLKDLIPKIKFPSIKQKIKEVVPAMAKTEKQTNGQVFSDEEQRNLECIEVLTDSAERNGRTDVVEKLRTIYNDFFDIHHGLDPRGKDDE